jgi:ribosomal protein S18 acetylase RimI-like enzyme
VKAADLDAILAIERASFGRDAYDRKLFADLAQTCGRLFLVAERSGAVVGYSVACLKGARAELISIAVHPSHRGRGAASALMDSTLRRLRRRSASRFVLMVKVTNQPAIQFYERYRFRKLRRIHGYYEDGADGFLFVRLL